MDYFQRTRVNEIMAGAKNEQQVIILGWVRTKRTSKKVAFLELNDGSTLANVQAVFVPPEKFPVLEKILTGASVRVEGRVVHSPGTKQAYEIQADKLEIIGACPDDYPLQKKRHSFEYLREMAHLRPRTNTFGVINRFRSKLAYGVHRYFQERGFFYVHTPIITTSDCEGAGELFMVTSMGQEKQAREDFFGEPAGLTVSGQLEAELLCSALGDVYTFGPTFRAEDSHTSRHLSEFWMIEPEMAFCDLQEMMVLAEDFLKFLIRYSLTDCKEEMDFFNKWINKGRRQLLEGILDASFATVTYTDAVEILKEAGKEFEFPVEWGLDLQSEHERFLAEEYFRRPVIVKDYPRQIKAFYMRRNDDDKTVRAMDILAPQVGEIVGGSQREERYQKLRQSMIEHNLDIEKYKWFLDIRCYGTVPHAGFGLGFERMIMYLSGMGNVRDVISFPRTPGNARF